MEISVMTGLAGYDIAFLAVTHPNRLNVEQQQAIRALRKGGVKKVVPLSFIKASNQIAKMNNRQKDIPAEHIYLSLTQKNKIVPWSTKIKRR